MATLFNRFVEVGRVALINYGPDRGKLATIVDVIDHNRVLIDGPSDITGVARQPIKMLYLSLTNLKVDIPHSARLATLRKAFNKAQILDKWNKTSWAKKLAQKKKRESTTDFDRFKLMVARKQKSKVVRKELNKLRTTHNKKVTADKKPKLVISRRIKV